MKTRKNKQLTRRILLTAPVLAALVLVHFAAGFSAADQEEMMDEKLAKATFAGGCFWCMEPPFDKLDGVVSTTSGYTGGTEENPTYNQVSDGRTGHAEAVEILYDPEKVSYEKLLEVYWMQINPTTPDRQFVDVGRQYRPAIFYHNEQQRRLAEASKEKIAASGRFDGRIVVEIEPAGPFWPAEDGHQDFYIRNSFQYKIYRFGSGRDQYLKKIWGEK